MPNVVLALHLLCEVHNPESQRAPYLKILPSEYTIPLYFTPDDVKQLKGSPVYSEAINQLRNIARQYTYFFKLFQIYENAGSIPIRHFCFDDYRWAAATVMTRQNQIPSEDGSRRITALIPLWDMCNHKNGELTTDFSLEKQCCQCFAMENLIQGDQVYIFYGNRPNAEFLVHNGFVYHRNQHDKVAVKMGISKNDPLYNSKMDVMAKVALPASRSYYLHTGSDPVDSELLMFSRIHCITQEELDFCLSDTFKRSRLRDFDTLVSLENEKKAWEFLYTRTQLLYKVYVYSKGIDEPHTAHEALIRDEVATERRILNTASQYCHHQAQQVGKQMQDKTLLMKDGVPLENGSVSDGPDRGFHGLVADMPQVPRSALAADEAQLAKEIDEIELNF
jgi:histone-lysine N-methyltransferase SETD3